MKSATLIIHPEELSKKWIDRLVKEGIPVLGLHPVGGHRANESLSQLVEDLKTDKFRELLDYAAEKGLKIEYEMHAARYLLPADNFDAHPEWFRLDSDGKRNPDYNLCVSNDEALDFMAERAADLVPKLYRSTDRYFLWMDDGKDCFCHCPECSKLSQSEQQMKVLNRILGRLKKDNENASLAYLAYIECINAPEKIAPEKGIFLEYAPFLRDFHKPMSENDEYKHLPALLSLFGREKAKVLDYWYDNSLFSNWKKPPVKFLVDREVMDADFALYRELGFEDISSFACYLGDDYEALHGEPDISDFGRAYKNF